MTKPKARTKKRPRRHPPPPTASVPAPDGLPDTLGHPCPTTPFILQEDGVIYTAEPPPTTQTPTPETAPGAVPSPPRLVLRDDSRSLWIYHGNCLELLDAIAAKYPEGRFECIFTDPPYFLSNGGITCHAGRMVKVDKGDWDKSRGPELNHEFNLEWLRRCQRVLKPNGTIWVTGTHHVIFSIGFAMQQLGFKILNEITWEKPNPPPNLSCRYFTHSTETVLWAAKNERSKHTFNYALMRQINGGKQMKTVWTMPAPGRDEKTFGKHPTQKPLALVERCLLASTHPGDLVLDPFLGSGTTAVACVRLKLRFVGIEQNVEYIHLSLQRIKLGVESANHCPITIRTDLVIFVSNDLDLLGNSIHGSQRMADLPEIQSECIWHECKFVFLSCAQVSQASVVHTSVEASLQEAWLHAPLQKRRETTHIVRCRTEIFRIHPETQKG